ALTAVGCSFLLDTLSSGVAAAACIIGVLIGSLVAGRLSDYIGRRGVFLLVGPFLMFEAIFCALCPYLGGYPFLLFCRIVGGMCFGAATTVAPGYVAETSPARIRGRLIPFRHLAIILGLLFVPVVNLVLTNLARHSSAQLFLGFKACQSM
ncbi:UNVERIFIED_CONTAM: MFS transporter, partial [Bifidobacterium breve]